MDIETVVLTIFLGLGVLFLLYRSRGGPSPQDKSGDSKNFPPGDKASDAALGNLGDVGQAGSLHQYLMALHSRHGDVASFFWGPSQVVSLASPTSWRDTIKLFDRPVTLFELFMPLIGKSSIQYANGKDGKERRRSYVDPVFSHQAVGKLYDGFVKVTKDAMDRWDQKLTESKDQGIQIDCHQEMTDLALRSIALSAFGGGMEDEKETEAIRKAYDTCWHDMEVRMGGSFPEPGSDRQKAFDEALASMHGKVDAMMQLVKGKKSEEKASFVTLLLEHNVSPDFVKDEMVTFLVGGFHTTGNMLTWALYYLAKHPDVQVKLREELAKALPDQEVPTHAQVRQLTYLQQVIDETLRCSVLAPWAARVSSEPATVGGYAIPANTPMIQALGVVLMDPKIWDAPEEFRPERFAPAAKKKLPRLAYSPFGFAGKRICPGYRYAIYEAAVVLSAIVLKYTLSVPDEYEAVRVYGLVTSPKEEVPLTIRALNP